MGKSTISMAIFNSYVKLPEGSLSVWNSVDFNFLPPTRKKTSVESSRSMKKCSWNAPCCLCVKVKLLVRQAPFISLLLKLFWLQKSQAKSGCDFHRWTGCEAVEMVLNVAKEAIGEDENVTLDMPWQRLKMAIFIAWLIWIPNESSMFIANPFGDIYIQYIYIYILYIYIYTVYIYCIYIYTVYIYTVYIYIDWGYIYMLWELMSIFI